jgi:hypothetical protein
MPSSQGTRHAIWRDTEGGTALVKQPLERALVSWHTSFIKLRATLNPVTSTQPITFFTDPVTVPKLCPSSMYRRHMHGINLQTRWQVLD